MIELWIHYLKYIILYTTTSIVCIFLNDKYKTTDLVRLNIITVSGTTLLTYRMHIICIHRKPGLIVFPHFSEKYFGIIREFPRKN